MLKDKYWFQHDSNASQDLKCKALRRHYKWQGQGWYWFIIETMRNEDNYELEYSTLTFESLADGMLCTPEETKSFIDYCIEPCRLFKKNETHFWSERLRRDMAKLDDKKEVPVPTKSKQSSEEYIKELRGQFPDLDIDIELKKFTLYWEEPGRKKLKDTRRALLNWMVKAREIKDKNKPPKPLPRRIYDDAGKGLRINE